MNDLFDRYLRLANVWIKFSALEKLEDRGYVPEGKEFVIHCIKRAQAILEEQEKQEQ